MKILILIALGVLAYAGYQRMLPPAPIDQPVFAEIRINMAVSGREIEAAIFGKTTDEADCRARSLRVSDHLKVNCPYCVIQSSECKPSLAPRYAKFFDDIPTSATYLSMNASNRGERDVRMILWGLTGNEGDTVCEQMRTIFHLIHSGPLKCIRGTRT